jgi:Transposase
MQKESVKKNHRKYDAAFKSEALHQIEDGRSVPEVARSLGISDNKVNSKLPFGLTEFVYSIANFGQTITQNQVKDAL